MPRNTQKSNASTTGKTNRLSKLLKKNRKKGNKTQKSSKSHHHLQIADDAPRFIAHRKSSPFMMTTNVIHQIEPYKDSPSSSIEHEQRPKRSVSHHQYHPHPPSKIDKLNLNTNPNINSKSTRNAPPPPPKTIYSHHQKSNTTNIHSKPKSVGNVGHRTNYQHHNDNNININIDIKKHSNNISPSEHSNTRRSRHNSLENEAMSPHSSQSTQSSAERFISHIPRHSIEHKINMKQLLFEMIEMKRQIKSLKKDVKYLKTENDLCHRRITFLEQTVENQNKTENKSNNNNSGGVHIPIYAQYYPPPPAILQPQPDPSIMTQMSLGPSHNPIETRPKRLSLSEHTKRSKLRQKKHKQRRRNRSSSPISPISTEPLNLDKTEDTDDMETRLRKLSRKLSNTNVFSNEYSRLEYELETLIKQNDEENNKKNNKNIDEMKRNNNYYHEMDGNKHCQYNADTMVIHKKQKDKNSATDNIQETEKRLYSISTYYCSDTENEDKDGINNKNGNNNNNNNHNDDDDEKEINNLQYGSMDNIQSLCTLSRRPPDKLSTKKKYKNESFDITDDYKVEKQTIVEFDDGNDDNNRYHHRRDSTMGEGMEIID